MSNKKQNIEWLPVHPGKKLEQLRRQDQTPEQRKAYDAARDVLVRAMVDEKSFERGHSSSKFQRLCQLYKPKSADLWRHVAK